MIAEKEPFFLKIHLVYETFEFSKFNCTYIQSNVFSKYISANNNISMILHRVQKRYLENFKLLFIIFILLALKQTIPPKKGLIFSLFDTLKVTIAGKWCPKALTKGKESKILLAAIKFKKICFWGQGSVMPC